MNLNKINAFGNLKNNDSASLHDVHAMQSFLSAGNDNLIEDTDSINATITLDDDINYEMLYRRKGEIMVGGEYITEIYKWYTEGRLVVNRRYQRKLVWTLREKQQFINTLLSKYPVPLFLIVNASQNVNETEPQYKEILDGLQRLEAIISFILNKYAVKIDGEYQYFNLDAYPGNRPLIDNGILQQKYPVMDFELSRNFLLYQLPVSTISADDTVVDDIFKRINATGRKLSAQDLRQAGVTSKFSELVRIIATHLRGDATDDIVNMNEIADYSLSSLGLEYGLDINEIFWIEHGIIAEDALRRSKDEEIIAILCNCILSNYSCGMSVDSINKLYNVNSNIYKEYEETLTPNKMADMIDIFRYVISDIENVCKVTNSTFTSLLFSANKNYNKDLVFIVLFLSLAQLHSENYFIDDYTKVNKVLYNLADRELGEIIHESSCLWNTDVRTHLIDRVKNVLIKHMIFRENNPEWNTTFVNFLKQLVVEGQMHDFKIGFHDLRNGKENETLIPKCMKTLIAMANTRPYEEGTIIFGISDKESDAADFENYYGINVPKYNEYFVPGIKEEAVRFYGSIQNYTRFIKDSIEKMEIAEEVRHYVLANMDTLKYENQILVVLKLKSDKPIFFDGELYVRHESHDVLVKPGSNEFYEVFRNFNRN